MELINPQQLYQHISSTLEQASKGGPEAYPILLGAVFLCGAVYAFFGYRIYRWVLVCFGVCAGAFLAFQAVSQFQFEGVNMQYVRLSLAAIFALVGGILAPKLFHLLTFVLGGSAIALALHPLVPVIPEPYGWLILIIGFAAGGFLAFLLMRATLILATSVAGSYIAILTLFNAATHYGLLPASFNFLLFEITWGALTLFAVLSQTRQQTPSHIDAYGRPAA